MYLFSRQTRLSGSNLPAAMSWAVDMTEHVKSMTAMQVTLFTEVYSAAPGTLVWSTVVDDLTVLETAFDKLMADSRYHELVATGLQYGIPGTLKDMLRTIVYPTEAPPADAPMPEYVTCTYSTIANGQIARAVPIGVEIAQRVTQLTGTPTIFAVDSTGSYGGVAWLGFSSSIAEMQQGEEKINTDPSFVEFIDKEAATAFVGAPGTTSRIIRRVV
jgi:hypothetical protein